MGRVSLVQVNEIGRVFRHKDLIVVARVMEMHVILLSLQTYVRRNRDRVAGLPQHFGQAF
jgi:hypothetical protein